MRDFKEWMTEKGYYNLEEKNDRFGKEPIRGGSFIKYKDKKSNQVRDIRKDLDKDYKNYASSFGTTWPFKVLAKGNAKPIAKVKK